MALTFAVESFQPNAIDRFVASVSTNLSSVAGITPGTVMTWDQVLKLSADGAMDAQEKHTVLQQQIFRLELSLEKTENYIAWLERARVSTIATAATVSIAFPPAAPAAGVVVAVGEVVLSQVSRRLHADRDELLGN